MFKLHLFKFVSHTHLSFMLVKGMSIGILIWDMMEYKCCFYLLFKIWWPPKCISYFSLFRTRWKMTHRKRSYKAVWEKQFFWLEPVENDQYRASCKICWTRFRVGGRDHNRVVAYAGIDKQNSILKQFKSNDISNM